MDAIKIKTVSRLTEADLLAKGHSHIVEGSLRYDPQVNKQKVTINTRNAEGAFDGQTREIATSDLHQCYWTVEVKDAMDAAKRNAKAKEKRAKAKANAPAPAKDVKVNNEELAALLG